jgi:hypothetical protein
MDVRMNITAASHFAALFLTLGWFAAASGCGELQAAPPNDGNTQGNPPDQPNIRDAEAPFDEGFGSEDGEPSEGQFVEDGDDGSADGESFDGNSFDGGFDAEAFDGDSFDGESFDADVPSEAGPPWEGGAPAAFGVSSNAWAVALDDINVYWLDFGNDVFACPLTGCPNNTPTLLSLNGEFNSGFEAIAGGSGMAFLLASGAVDSCAGSGCSLVPATYWALPAKSDPFSSAIVSDASNVYFADGYSLYECPIGPNCSSPTTLVKTADSVSLLAVSSGEVFYIDDSASAYEVVRAVPIGGGTPRLVCSSGSDNFFGVQAMAVSSGHVYMTTAADPHVYVCSPGSGNIGIFFNGETTAHGLAADEANVYWTTGGTVETCPIGSTCTGPRTIASGQSNPEGIAVNSTAVYWATATAIFSAAK